MAKIGCNLESEVKIVELEPIVVEKPSFEVKESCQIVDKPAFQIKEHCQTVEKPVFEVRERPEFIYVDVPQYELSEFNTSIAKINQKIHEIHENIPKLPTVEVKYKAPTSLIVGLTLSIAANIGAVLWLLS